MVGLAVLLWFLPLAASAEALDRVRVLILQDAEHVRFTADLGVAMDFPTGQKRLFAGPVTVTRGEIGLRINGESVQSETVTVRGRGTDLAVSERTSVLVVGGEVRVVRNGKSLQLINEIDLEEYVKGVVPSEMNAGWGAEALKVQAVATRTYAIHQQMMNGAREYDLVASTQDQVYRGRFGVDPRVQEAVEATRGLVLTYRNAPIFAAFSSTAAGPTEDASNVWAKDLPYLKGVDCPFDANSPYYQWRVVVNLGDLQQTFRRQGIAVGDITAASVFTRSLAGRATRLRFLHSEGELIIRGEELRRLVGYTVIPSTQFDLEFRGREVVLAGRGAGHAVGLCQWGAKELAERGYSYRAILHYYFPGTELKDLRSANLASPSLP
jgi:stage II sporulation protein D